MFLLLLLFFFFLWPTYFCCCCSCCYLLAITKTTIDALHIDKDTLPVGSAHLYHVFHIQQRRNSSFFAERERDGSIDLFKWTLKSINCNCNRPSIGISTSAQTIDICISNWSDLPTIDKLPMIDYLHTYSATLKASSKLCLRVCLVSVL